MPYQYRYWWFHWLGFMIALVVLIGEVILSPIQTLSDQGISFGDIASAFTLPLIALYCCLALLLIGTVVYITVGALRDRRNGRLLQAAIRGRPELIPTAKIRVDSAAAPDVSREPLVYEWAASSLSRFGTTPLLLVRVGILLVVFLLIIIGTPAYFIYIAFFSPETPITIGPLQIAIGITIFLAAVLICGALIWVFRALPTLFGRPFGVTATQEGIAYRGELGERRFLRWDEMRLLEVKALGRGGLALGVCYRLYSDTAYITWKGRMRDKIRWPTSSEIPVDMTPDEAVHRQQALLNLIAARTGLTPRTLSKSLM